ncbi:MAG: LTA synthase family protein, partial [Lachnospiraceae bacterium]|nr:LTA synthase family protein [Lachnospiraceae bacterium]
ALVLILTMNFLTHQTKFESNFMHANYLFTTKASYRDNGFFITFMQYLKYMKISKPSGYDVKKLDQILHEAAKQYDEDTADIVKPAEDQKPNIIVIMDEAFSDIAVLGELAVNKDYMPFLRELTKSDRCVSGWMDMSVCGGNTASSEFETLTNNSMYYLPNGSVAYQQYISSDIPSLARILNAQGYQSTAIHPYNAAGWDRNEVYPYMGFETFLSLKDFSNTKKLRKYVSDESAFDKIVSVYEKNSAASDAPQFIFEVTMQNHGGYSEIFDNCPIEVEALNFNRDATDNYLTLVYHTDQAMEKLITYFENTDDPTMIVMFGDHQPNDFSIKPLWQYYGVDQSQLTTEQLMERYVVPFYIWTNYDTGNDTENIKFMSPNYLSTVFLTHAGLELSDYQKYLYELKKELPVICQNAYRDADGNFYANGESSQYDAKLKEYQALQYNFLFDDQKGNEPHYTVGN